MTPALCFATISLAAIKHNLSVVRRYAPNSRIFAILKANAYGHGLVPVARALDQADAFAVARIDEGVELRQHTGKDIIVLSGCSGAINLQLCAQNRLQPVIHNLGDWQLLKQYLPELAYWLKVDTGMHRLGLSAQEFQTILASDDQLCLGVISHLSDAEQLDCDQTAKQIQQFEQLLQSASTLPASLANSAGILYHPNAHFDWVRPGIMMYGLSPKNDDSETATQLQAAMSLQAKVVAIHEIAAGESVGYNGRWQAAKNSRIATIAIGYADGYPRHAKDGTPVWINGKTYPLAGKVSMDLITVDVTGGAVSVGDVAELWGQNLSANTVAEWADTISYQLLTGVSQRVARHYLD